MAEEVQKHSIHTLVFRSLKRTHEMFLTDYGSLPPKEVDIENVRKNYKVRMEYGPVLAATAQSRKKRDDQLSLPPPPETIPAAGNLMAIKDSNQLAITAGKLVPDAKSADAKKTSYLNSNLPGQPIIPSIDRNTDSMNNNVKAVLPRRALTMPKPQWHPPWKLYRVISGHTGWVRCIDVEPGNEWFCTGAGDRIIKIWDLATGTLKLSLTGHISTVRGLKVSARQPYLFSCGEDKQVKCWDLEYNKVTRHYHGHLSAVYTMALHPTIDVLITGSRDSTVRVWDMRTKANIHVFSGHSNTVASVVTQAGEPQIISGSHDSTIRLWDLAAGRSRVTLTNHKKSVRALAVHPSLYMFASASPDNVKQWQCPDGKFMQNLNGHNAILNALAVNQDNVMMSGGDNGSMFCWDWKTGHCFQKIQAKIQPGSIDSEAGIFALQFDQSGTRLITAEADKTIKMYKEDEDAEFDLTMKALTDIQKGLMIKAWQSLHGNYPSRSEFNSKQDLDAFAKYYSAFRILSRVPLNKRKEDVLRDTLSDSKLSSNSIEEMIKLVMREPVIQRDLAIKMARPNLPSIKNLQWKLSVVISTSQTTRVLQPVIDIGLVLNDDRTANFELSLSKFHLLRYTVAKLLKETETLSIKH